MKYLLLLLLGVCYGEDIVMPPVPNWAFKPVLHISPAVDHTLPAVLCVATDYIYTDGNGKILDTKFDCKFVNRDEWVKEHGPLSENDIDIYARTGLYKRTIFICLGVY